MYSESPPQTSWWSKSKGIIGPLFGWWPEYKKSKVGLAGLVIAIIFVAAIILAPVLATHSPTAKPDAGAIPVDEWYLQSPSWQHLLGTNSQGQDLWSRLLYAGRVSLMIGVVASAGVVLIGSAIGILAGYFGGIVDEILTRIADILLVLPRLPLMIILAAFMGPGVGTIVFVVVVLGWTRVSRQVRAMTYSAKEYSFVEASRAAGAGHMHIMWYHILPNVIGVVIANFVLEVVTVLMLEAGLAFLGLGDPQQVSWGVMLHFAQTDAAFSEGAWWWWLPPGLCIAFLGAAFSFIGNTINDKFVLRLKNIRG